MKTFLSLFQFLSCGLFAKYLRPRGVSIAWMMCYIRKEMTSGYIYMSAAIYNPDCLLIFVFSRRTWGQCDSLNTLVYFKSEYAWKHNRG